MTKPSDTTRMHSRLIRPTYMTFSSSAATRYGLYFRSFRKHLTGLSDQIIESDPLSHEGYEGKHAALVGIGRHGEAFEAFKIMLSKFEQSPDPKVRGKPLR